MLNFNDLVATAYESAYGTAYDLSLKKKYSRPKIYTGKGDLKKRWYVYFSYRNPETGKLEMQTPYYGDAHNYKTKEDRLAVLSVYCKIITELLDKGYSPYEDNTERFYAGVSTEVKEAAETPDEPKKEEKLEPKPTQEPKIKEEAKDRGRTLEEALDYDMELKKKLLADSSMRSYKSHLGRFRKWMKKYHPEIKYILDLKRATVQEFLNGVLKETSPRNHNNYRASLSSMMGTLESNDIIPHNFLDRIKKYSAAPKRHEAYSREEQEQIFSYLEEHDPLLLLFIQCASYSFMRPIEVCRLKIGNIDQKELIMKFKAKNKPLKTKIIPEILSELLPDLSKYDKGDYLFTPEGMGKKWAAKLESRRNYFSKRFKKVVKNKFGFDENHGIYSFRHYFTIKSYRHMLKTMTSLEAKQKLMLITGHTSMSALEKYLRDIDAELPQDYSNILRS